MFERQKSREKWQDSWFKVYADRHHDHRTEGIDGKDYFCSNWILGKEIRIMRVPGVDGKVVPYVKAGIEELLNQLGLKLQVKDYGVDETVIQQVNRSINQENGFVDGYHLSKELITEHWRDPTKRGTPHADVVLVDKYLTRGTQDWGQAEFFKGYMVLALPNGRQNSLDFIKHMAKHEAGHLLGFDEHHDSKYAIVNGYEDEQKLNCNMLWEASTLYTCRKCLEAIASFWVGVEKTTGQKFLKY